MADDRTPDPDDEREGAADGAPASGAPGGGGPPGLGEDGADIGLATEGMPDPPELADDDD